ncbi:MAG TPA: sensor histidine kinase [Methylotenera sp.]|nr:sensor histidine kinase [Methylotenera sp.]
MQESERKRIARDLHDDLGQYLSAIKAQAASLLVELDSATEIHLTAKSIAASADHAYVATRNLMHSLRPVALDDLGLSAALEHLVDTWQSINFEAKRVNPETKHTNYILAIEGDIDELKDSAKIAIFRIIQEALTNCAKHAHANTIHVSIVKHQENLKLSIIDDGIGCDTKLPTFGFGLLGIQERVDALNGQLQIISGHKLGLKMFISIEASA